MKILIIGISYFHYAMSLVRAGNLLGHTVKSLWLSEFRDSKAPYWKKKAAKHGFKYFETRYLNKVNENFIQEIIDFKPEICIVLNGKDIDVRVLDVLKAFSVRVALFMSDSLQYDCYKEVLFNIEKYDEVFSYEPTDIVFTANQQRGRKINYLPIGYDETIFFPDFHSEKQYDICFVGELNKKRFKILNKVAEYAKLNHKRFVIYTNPLYPQRYFLHRIRNFFRKRKFHKRYPYLMEYVVDHPIYDKELADLYRKSKICLNIHSDGFHTGANPRTFEILGCGSFEIVDRGHLFPLELKVGEHIMEFYNEEDLCEKIDKWLCEREKAENIALEAWNLVSENYTMKKCVDCMIKILMKR